MIKLFDWGGAEKRLFGEITKASIITVVAMPKSKFVYLQLHEPTASSEPVRVSFSRTLAHETNAEVDVAPDHGDEAEAGVEGGGLLQAPQGLRHRSGAHRLEPRSPVIHMISAILVSQLLLVYLFFGVSSHLLSNFTSDHFRREQVAVVKPKFQSTGRRKGRAASSERVGSRAARQHDTARATLKQARHQIKRNS